MQPPSTETLVSSLDKFERYNALPGHSTHPFNSKAGDSVASLRDLIDTANTLSNALSIYSSVSWSNPKLISLVRQISNISQTLQTSEKNSHHIIAALRQRTSVSYGESIPLDPTNVPYWCISRLEAWCKFAGLEAFKDENHEGDATTIVLGGKVLVVDIDFTFDRTNALQPRANVSRVKTSYAITTQSTGPSNASGSLAIDTFLATTIQRFCTEIQKKVEVRDPQKASQLGKDVLQQLEYLVMLDQLAQRQGEDGGLKWFIGIDKLFPVLESFATNEARIVASSLSLPEAPLDIFLRRSHALPLPYLVYPSISFLVYVSPTAYLSILRNAPSLHEDDQSHAPLDVPIPYLRSQFLNANEGATIVTLLLDFTPNSSFDAPIHAPTLASRPNFPLVPPSTDLDDIFPHVSEPMDGSSSHVLSRYEWVLDFTGRGKERGIVMSQSRMREIELVLNPLGGMDTSMGSMGSMGSYIGGSWVDLLFSDRDVKTSEFYTATYTSPSSLHPPLHIRLTVPEEPGFLLERVPVHGMREVWGVLEVVREQCWLNETLNCCEWKSEESLLDEIQTTESDATDEELHTILSGTFVPHILPVNLYLPPNNIPNDPLFDPLPLSGVHKPKIVMTSPERSPITGLVDITVAFDETKHRGISVDVHGAVGADIRLDILEEVSRRGGTLGLPGRIWSRSHSSLQI